MVKAAKGEHFNGYFKYKAFGREYKFTSENAHHFIEIYSAVMAESILDRIDGNASLVPIPNSCVTDPDDAKFNVRKIAEAIAAHSNGKLKVVPAIVFATPQKKSHEGGPRNISHFEGAMKILRGVRGGVVLIDDVITTGSHMIAAARKLIQANSTVVLGGAVGRTTKEQVDRPVMVSDFTLDLFPERKFFGPIE